MNNNSQVFKNGDEDNRSFDTSSASFLGKTFLYLFLGILASALICLGLSYALFYGLSNGSTDTMAAQMVTYLVILVISGIGLLVTSIVINVKQMKMKNILVPYILYCSFMGVMLSSLVVFIGDPYIVGVSLAISSIIFLVMCIFGFLWKGRVGWVVGLLVGGLVSMTILFFVNMILFPLAFAGVTSAFDAYCTTYWIIEGICLLMIMLSTFLDMWNIKKIADSGSNSTNISLYCAMNLYSDFIILFLRVLYFVLLAGGRRKD